MLSMRPDPEIRVQKVTIPAGRRRIPALVLSPNEAPVLACCGFTAAGTFSA